METSNPSAATMPHLQARQSCAPSLQKTVLMTIKTQLGEINWRNQAISLIVAVPAQLVKCDFHHWSLSLPATWKTAAKPT